MDLSPSSGRFNRSLESRQASFYPQGSVPRAMPVQGPPYVYLYPQPGYQSIACIPGQYALHAQPISRNSSLISEQRSASSIGQPQISSMTPSISRTYTPQPKANSTPFPAFTTPSARAHWPPIITSTPTPPPTISTPQHARTSTACVSGKTREQHHVALQERLKKAAEADSSRRLSRGEKDAKTVKSKLKEEQKAKEEAAPLRGLCRERRKSWSV
jgi:hypothetical protein